MFFGICFFLVKWGYLGEWVLGFGLKKRREVGMNFGEKVCFRFEGEGRGLWGVCECVEGELEEGFEGR